MLVTFEVSQFEIAGKVDNEEHSMNIPPISVTF
jgi:hypothetical protein